MNTTHTYSRNEDLLTRLSKNLKIVKKNFIFPAVLGLTFRKEKEKLILLVSQPSACDGQWVRSLLFPFLYYYGYQKPKKFILVIFH